MLTSHDHDVDEVTSGPAFRATRPNISGMTGTPSGRRQRRPGSGRISSRASTRCCTATRAGRRSAGPHRSAPAPRRPAPTRTRRWDAGCGTPPRPASPPSAAAHRPNPPRSRRCPPQWAGRAAAGVGMAQRQVRVEHAEHGMELHQHEATARRQHVRDPPRPRPQVREPRQHAVRRRMPRRSAGPPRRASAATRTRPPARTPPRCRSPRTIAARSRSPRR